MSYEVTVACLYCPKVKISFLLVMQTNSVSLSLVSSLLKCFPR